MAQIALTELSYGWFVFDDQYACAHVFILGAA